MNYEYLCMGCMTNKGIAEICPHCGYSEGSDKMNPLYLQPKKILNNRYIIGKSIGNGGFGITYIAWDTKLNIPMAIKEYLPHTLASRSDETKEIRMVM